MAIVSCNEPGFLPAVRQYLDGCGKSGWQILELSIDNEGATLSEEMYHQ